VWRIVYRVEVTCSGEETDELRMLHDITERFSGLLPSSSITNPMDYRVEVSEQERYVDGELVKP
jgi:hypothetical protein